MKLATYRLPGDGGVRHGQIVGDGRVTDLGPGDLSAVIGTLGSLPFPVGTHALDEVTLLAPLTRPGKVLAVAANYQEHVQETGGDRLDKSRISPRLFLKPSTAVSGPGEEIAIPSVSPDMDGEAELVAVIGRGGKDIPLEDALKHVGGYTIGNGVQMVAGGRGERDLLDALTHPASVIGSDGQALDPDGPTGRGTPHPRSYGCYPRLFAEYVRRPGGLGPAEAVRKCTSAPASRAGLAGRGVLRAGAVADITVFDPARIADRATFTAPQQYPDGIRAVLVGGRPVVEDGVHGGTRTGEILRIP